MLYRAHHALAATTPGTEAHERAQGRWQRAFTDIDAHRILQASDAAKGLLHPAAATVSNEWDGWPATRTCRSCRWTTTPPSAPRALRSSAAGAQWATRLAADV